MLQRGDEPIAGYTLEAFLGKGTFGEVWRASARSGASVALKFIDISGQAGVREYRGIQRVKDVRHPHLMPITDIWMLDASNRQLDEAAVARWQAHRADSRTTVALPAADERPSLLVVAMPLAEEGLAVRLAECQLETGMGIPEEDLLRYMEQAAQGVDFLNLNQHDVSDGRATIQHCDIKPENMMLLDDSVVIGDFGLAKVLGESQKTTTVALGTPAYLAPELLLTQRASQSTDQYSLACSYYHLRTGALPFDGNLSLPFMLEVVKSGKLDFSQISGSRERSVLRRATSLDPDQRYDSAEQFVDELRRAISEDRLVADEASGHSWSRTVAGWTIAVVLFTATVSLLLYTTGSPWIASTRPDQVATQGHDVASAAESFEAVSNQFERDWQRDRWQPALALLREHAKRHPSAASKWSESLLALTSLANEQLDDAPGKAAEKYDVVLSELAARKVEGSLPERTRLQRARAAARLGDWHDVSTFLDELPELLPSLSTPERGQSLAISILYKTRDDSRQFFDDETLTELEQMSAVEPDEIGLWESQQLAQLKAAAGNRLAAQPELAAADPRVQNVLRAEFEMLETLATATEQLHTEDAATIPFSRLRSQLDDVVNRSRAVPLVQERARVLRSVLDLRDARANLGDVVAAIPDHGLDVELAHWLLAVLLARLESAALEGRLDESELDRVAPIVTRFQSTEAESEATTQTIRALRLAMAVQQADPDWAQIQAECTTFRNSKHATSPSMALIVNAAWAESLLSLDDRPTFDKLQREELAGLTASFARPDLPSPSREYVTFVRSRILAADTDPAATGEALQPLLEACSTPQPLPFFAASARREFAVALLLDAAKDLRTAGTDQLTVAAFTEEAAEQARRYLEIAVTHFEARSPDTQRYLALACFQAKYPAYDRVLGLLATTPPSREEAGDGQLLLARSVSHANSPAADRGAMLSAFAELFAWWSRFGQRDSAWSFYQQAIIPALRAIEPIESQIRNLRADDAPVDVSAVASPLRPKLAQIYALSARLVAEDPDTQRALYRGQIDAALAHRRSFYRLASALDPTQLDYLLGEFLAIRFSPDGTFAATANQLLDLADRAAAQFQGHPATHGMLAESLVHEARRTLDPGRQRTLLSQAFEDFAAASAISNQQQRATFLLLAGGARADLARLATDRQERVALLKEAQEQAEAAARLGYQPVEDAYLAAGLASELMAFEGASSASNYGLALRSYATAAESAVSAERTAAAAGLSAGRARWRRASQAHADGWRADQPFDLLSQVTIAIDELQQGWEESQSSNQRARAAFFLSQAYELLGQVSESAEQPSHQQESTEWLQRAIESAGALDWAAWQTALASRTLEGGNPTDARELALRVLAEKSADKYIVQWKWVFEALRVILLASDPSDRESVIRQYASRLPADDPAAVPYRIRWFLLYANQHRSPDDGNPATFRQLAEEALTLAREEEQAQLMVLARVALGRLAFADWFQDTSNDVLLTEASRSLGEAIRDLEQVSDVELDAAAIGECYWLYGVIELRRYRGESNPTIRDAIRRRTVSRISAHRQQPETPREVRQQLQQVIAGFN